jgi:hypothetical protein
VLFAFAALRLLADTTVPSTTIQVALLTGVIAPVIAVLVAYTRWAMKQIEKLQAEITDTYKTVMPPMQQMLASQREMLDASKTQAEVTRSLLEELGRRRPR